MGTFLKNSDDIIIDAILTSHGRAAIASNDDSQKITRFAVFDDEIDYSLYRSKYHTFGEHPSGSSHFDLDILQRPVLQAFSKGGMSGKSKLVTLEGSPDYLPILRLNFNRKDFGGTDSRPTFGNLPSRVGTGATPSTEYGPDGWAKEHFLVIFDEATLNKLNGHDKDAGVINSFSVIGENSDKYLNFLNAFQPDSDIDGGCISVEHGIHNNGTIDRPITPYDVEEYLSGDYPLDEKEFFIQYDARFAAPYHFSGHKHINRVGNTFGEYTFENPIEDQSIRASDYDALSLGTLQGINPTEMYSEDDNAQTVIAGPRSFRLNFKLGFGLNDSYASYLSSRRSSILNDPKHFEENGIELTAYESELMFGEDVTYGSPTTDMNGPFYYFKYIDKEIKVFSGTTGYSISIPLRYLKLFT